MKRFVRMTLVAGLLAAPFSVSVAHDSGSPTGAAATPDPLDQGRALIAARQWPAAIAELAKVNAVRDADWNNLMGFAHRKADPPDLAAAEQYYRSALSINPKHLGTLEYLGELRLQQGDLPGAEAQLAALRKATFLKSREFKDLQATIDRYKSAGFKYVPAD